MKITFASCAKIQDRPEQPAWKDIENAKPDHLLLLGDNIYAPFSGWHHQEMKKRYDEQFSEANFKSLIDKIPYNAIWDDHDFGPNNANGADHPIN